MTIKQIFLVLGLTAAAVATGFGVKHLKDIQRATQANRPGPATSQRVLSNFDIITNLEVVDPDSALGNRFFLGNDDLVYHVQLYFIECPPVQSDENAAGPLGRLSRYFGGVPFEKLIEIGQSARNRSLGILGEGGFRMATRFQPLKGRDAFHAFILLGDKDNVRYLSEILVSEGLAAINSEGSFLPYGESGDAFRRHLARLEAQARRDRVGAWAFSRNPDDPQTGAAGRLDTARDR